MPQTQQLPDDVEIRFDNLKFVEQSILSIQGRQQLKDFISKELETAKQEEREKCKRVYVEYVDWSEWGISDEEAGENFDVERVEIDSLSHPINEGELSE